MTKLHIINRCFDKVHLEDVLKALEVEDADPEFCSETSAAILRYPLLKRETIA